jgi:transposase
MIKKEDFIVIHALKEKGYNISEIAKLTKLDRKTVRKRLLDVALVITNRTSKNISKLEAYKPYILDFVSKSNKRIPYSAIMRDIKDLGYTGGRSILQEFLTNYYKNNALKKLADDPVVRFETEIAEQMQVDWTTIRSGRFPIYAFVATLGYSRYTFVYFTDNMEANTLIMCHEKAFLFFGGTTKHILYDNMKAVVIERDKYGKGKHQYNAKLLDLSKTYGFRIKLCRPFRAKTKGKVERFNSYLKGNFYRPLVITLSDAKLEITHHVLNNSITPWLIEANGRLHGTTGKVPSEVFIEETPHLIKHGLVTRISNPKTQKPIMVPITVVQTTNLNKYDELLIGDVL